MNGLNPARPQFIYRTAYHRRALFFVIRGISFARFSSLFLFLPFSLLPFLYLSLSLALRILFELTHSFSRQVRVGVEFHESRDLALNDQRRTPTRSLPPFPTRLYQPACLPVCSRPVQTPCMCVCVCVCNGISCLRPPCGAINPMRNSRRFPRTFAVSPTEISRARTSHPSH